MTGTVTGAYGRRAFLLPRKSAMYRHVLICICARLSERGLAAQKVHGRGQGELVIHNHVSRKAGKFSRSHDSQRFPHGARGPGGRLSGALPAPPRSCSGSADGSWSAGVRREAGATAGCAARVPARLPPGPAAASAALSSLRALWPSTGDLRLEGPTPPSRFAGLGRTPATFTFGDLVWLSSVRL